VQGISALPRSAAKGALDQLHLDRDEDTHAVHEVLLATADLLLMRPIRARARAVTLLTISVAFAHLSPQVRRADRLL
jgi:hypothetical protein